MPRGGRGAARGLLGLMALAVCAAGCTAPDRLTSARGASPTAAGSSAPAEAGAAGQGPAAAADPGAEEALRRAEQERLAARDDALLAAAAEAERRREAERRAEEERDRLRRIARVRRQRAEIRHRFRQWHPTYTRELAGLLSARARLSQALAGRSLELAEGHCRDLRARVRAIDRRALLASPDRRVNEALEEMLAGYERGAAACAERSAVVAWTLLTAADELWAEVHRRIAPWVR